jgi:hypothetical protein
MKAYESACVVRKVEELVKTKEIASSIVLLGFIDQKLYEMSSVMHLRLDGVTLISYESDISGAPTFNQREKALLHDASEYYRVH